MGADRAFHAAPGFVGRGVPAEFVRVPEGAQGHGRAEIAAALHGLLSATEPVIGSADEGGVAVDRHRNDDADFGDLMIAAAARRADAGQRVAFERKAARLPGVRLLVP